MRTVLAAAALALLPSSLARGASDVAARPVDAERQAKLAKDFAEIDALFAAWVDRKEIPGMAWGVVVDGELAHVGVAGLRDVEAGAPVQRDTVFRIASMTKSFTAAAVLKLRDAGKLRLDDPVSRWIPDLGGAGSTRDAPPITIRHLLTHSAGFPEDNPWADRMLPTADAELDRMLRAGLSRSNPPGVAFEYSNFGFGLLGRIVARAAGVPYTRYVDEAFLKALGMRETVWDAVAVSPQRLAKGYRREGERWVEEPPLRDGAFGAPMAGLFTTVPDLARWVVFQLQAWPPRDDPDEGALRRASLREMQQAARLDALSVYRDAPDAPLRAEAWGYGYGLGVAQWCGMRHVVGHSGGLPGWGSTMRWLPERAAGIVVLANLTYASARFYPSARDAIAALQRSRAVRRLAARPGPELLAARRDVTALLERWDDALADRIAAENLFLDEPRAARRARFEALREAHGACAEDGDVDAENALRGKWRMRCARGWLEVTVTLAPTTPPRVQFLEVKDGLPLGERMARAAASIASLASRWSDGDAARLGVEGRDRDSLRSQLRALGASYGECRVGEALEGDGQAESRVRFLCARGDLDVALKLDPRSGRLALARFARPRGTDCVP